MNEGEDTLEAGWAQIPRWWVQSREKREAYNLDAFNLDELSSPQLGDEWVRSLKEQVRNISKSDTTENRKPEALRFGATGGDSRIQKSVSNDLLRDDQKENQGVRAT